MLSSVCAFIFRSVIAYTRVFYLNSVYVSLALTLKSIFFFHAPILLESTKASIPGICHVHGKSND